MNTKEKIIKTIRRNKTGLTAESLAERLNMKEKTVRNRLSELCQSGDVDIYEFYKKAKSGRDVYSYIAV